MNDTTDETAAPGTMLVLDASGQQIASAETDEDGYFMVDVPPGVYTLQLSDLDPFRAQFAPTTSVTVIEGSITEARLTIVIPLT
jgi:hypothetical protein